MNKISFVTSVGKITLGVEHDHAVLLECPQHETAEKIAIGIALILGCRCMYIPDSGAVTFVGEIPDFLKQILQGSRGVKHVVIKSKDVMLSDRATEHLLYRRALLEERLLLGDKDYGGAWRQLSQEKLETMCLEEDLDGEIYRLMISAREELQ